MHLLIAGMLALALGPAVAGAQPRPADRPNVVVILADDLGYGDLASYGHPSIRTPALDGLAAEGIRLTSFYAGAPSCTPSRAALLTGRYAARVGLPAVLGPRASTGLPDREVTLAEALRARGYRTAAVGKWHLGHLPRFLPTRHGFDSYFGVPYSNDMMPPWVAEGGPVPLLRDTTVVQSPIEQAALTRRFTEESIRFIREARGQPFFLYLAHSMPHLPIAASPAFAGRSRAGPYGDVIEELDWSVAQVLATLRELGLDRNTIVVFTSDNGPWLDLPARMLQGGVERWHAGSPGLLRGAKGTTYEGGIRVPAIIRWPGTVPRGAVSAEMATAMDLYVTLLRAAGAEVPSDRPVDGNDLLPLLTGRGGAPTSRFFFFQNAHLQGVRDGRWKLRVAAGAPGSAAVPELFDLELDPSERFDRAADHPDVVRRLSEAMRHFEREVRAPAPAP